MISGLIGIRYSAQMYRMCLVAGVNLFNKFSQNTLPRVYEKLSKMPYLAMVGKVEVKSDRASTPGFGSSPEFNHF